MAKLIYPQQVPIPKYGKINVFRSKTDGFRYYKRTDNSVVKLNDNGSGGTFLLDEPNVKEIVNYTDENLDIINTDEGLVLIFSAISVQQIQRIYVGGGGGSSSSSSSTVITTGASIADLGNVLFVSINGNDVTGTIGRIDKPFKTITAAKNAATAGDLIYVFAGTFNEATIQKDQVNYYFEPGAVVTNSGIIWDAFTAPASFTVRGYGKFITTSYCIDVETSASSVDIECDYISASINAVFCNAGYLRLKARFVSSADSYGITLRNACLADINIETLDCSNNTTQSAAVFIRNHSIDTIPRKVTLNINKCLSNANAGFSAVSMQNSANCTVVYNGDITHSLSNPFSYIAGCFTLNTGKIIYNGTAKTLDAHGATFVNIVGGVDNMEFVSGLIQTNLSCVRLSATTHSYFKQYANAVLNTTGDAPVVALGVGGYTGGTKFGNFESWGLIVNNTNVVGIPPQCHGVEKEGVLPDDTVFRMNGCKIITTVSGQTLNNQDGNPQNIQVMSGYGNTAITPAIFTNIITGTNLIIDTDLTDNPII